MTVQQRQRGVRPETPKIQGGRIVEILLPALLAAAGNSPVLSAGVILGQDACELGEVADAALLQRAGAW